MRKASNKISKLRKFFGVMLACLLIAASLAGCSDNNGSSTGTGTGTGTNTGMGMGNTAPGTSNNGTGYNPNATNTGNSMLSDSYDTNNGLGDNNGTGAAGYGSGYSIGTGVRNSDYQNSGVIGAGRTGNISADM